MSMDIRIGNDLDIYLNIRNEAEFVDGADRIKQQVGITLRTFIEEWFMDTSFGVPYFERIMVKSPKASVINSVLRTRIKDVPGVTRINTLDLDIDRQARFLAVSADIETTEGMIKVAFNT